MHRLGAARDTSTGRRHYDRFHSGLRTKLAHLARVSTIAGLSA